MIGPCIIPYGTGIDYMETMLRIAAGDEVEWKICEHGAVATRLLAFPEGVVKRLPDFEKIEKAVNLVLKGAKLIGTNPDITGPTEKGIMPATGALIAPIEIATGKKAYFVGKPNPLMLRHGLKKLDCHSQDIAFVGDRMDTDIIAGIESNVDTVLVLSGVTAMEDISLYPYRPKYVLNGVGDIVDDTKVNLGKLDW